VKARDRTQIVTKALRDVLPGLLDEEELQGSLLVE